MDVVYAGIVVVGLMAVFLAVGALILGFLIVLNGLVGEFSTPQPPPVDEPTAALGVNTKAADFRKGERTREEITDLMAGGEAMAELEAELETYQHAHAGHPPQAL